jgi:hypothetical protein
MRTRGPKARGYDTDKKEKHYLSYEKPHKKPVREDDKPHKIITNDKRADMIFMDSHTH